MKPQYCCFSLQQNTKVVCSLKLNSDFSLVWSLISFVSSPLLLKIMNNVPIPAPPAPGAFVNSYVMYNLPGWGICYYGVFTFFSFFYSNIIYNTTTQVKDLTNEEYLYSLFHLSCFLWLCLLCLSWHAPLTEDSPL